MIKKWIIYFVILVVVLTGWRVGTRLYMLRNVCRSPEEKYRVTLIPTELDMSEVQVKQGINCNVGYAEFTIPSANLVDLKSVGRGCAVLGETSKLSFAFLSPFDPSVPDSSKSDFMKELSKLPKGHPLREKLLDSNPTSLDLIIQMERTVPEPFWKTVFQDSAVFALNTMQLIMKGSSTGIGMNSMYTYHTAETRGLILVGENPKDMSKAQVYIESSSRNKAVGMHIRTNNANANNVIEILPTILKTFRFTIEKLGSEDEMKKIISEARILPKEEGKKSPTIQ